MRLLRAGLPGLVVALIPLTTGYAHEIVGNRFFPATLGIDDPGVNDELAVPTFDSFKTGDNPPVRQRDISGEFSKRITEDFAISFGSTYTFLGPIDSTAAGARCRCHCGEAAPAPITSTGMCCRRIRIRPRAISRSKWANKVGRIISASKP
jgi:hypothetical protein